MKKVILILIIVVISVFGLSFAGCSGAGPTQRLLSDSSPWLSNIPYVETSTYTVTRKDDTDAIADNGTYVVAVEKFVNTDINVGKNELKNFSGYVASSELKMNNGDSEKTVVAFTTNIELNASYSKIMSADGNIKEITALNTSKKYSYQLMTGGDIIEAEKSIKHKKFDAAPYIDKSMLYLITRCIPNTVASFGFQVLSTTKNNKLAVTMARPTILEDITIGSVPVACKVFSISENKTFPGKGTAYKCYISTKKLNGTTIVADDDLSASANKSAVMKIVENNMEYVLTSITNNKI